MKPETWETEPDAYLGRDSSGYDYYLLSGDVFRHQDGFTRWFSTKADWDNCKLPCKAEADDSRLAKVIFG